MNWAQIAFALSDILSVALIIRLINLRLHHVYKVFCAFLIFEIVSTSFTIIEKFSSLNNIVDYRVMWLVMRLASWTISIWMVYALLYAILANLPGILKFSRRVLNSVLPISLGAALLSAAPEYSASGTSKVSIPIDFLVGIGFVLERVVSTIALFTLLLVLFFILWFPVKMPRNLANFSNGFILYFSAKTTFLLVRSFWSHESFALVDNGVTFILCICLGYWIIFLNKQGEEVPVTLGHSWQVSKQTQLMGNLESLNATLSRAARR